MMRNIVKHWKEAATVILAAKSPVKISNGSGPWSQDFDFRLLMLKRSSKSKFMPSAYVFPGGVTSEADFSNEWSDVFEMDLEMLGTQLQPKGPRPPMFATKAECQPNGSVVPNEVAFRICAIRETFEESGVLIAKPQKEELNGTSSKILKKHPEGSVISTNEVTDLEVWRKKIDKDAANFVIMCKQLNLVPDVWSLMEWSNWLTPTLMKKLHAGRRYDTSFFVCCVDHIPDMAHDDRETVQSGWYTPADVYGDFQQEQLWIAPPQVYELARIAKIEKYKEFYDFNQQRANKGCQQVLPILATFTDGRASLYPGDDLYPAEPDFSGERDPPLDFDITLAESRAQATCLNRMEITGLYQVALHHNIVPPYGHIAPVRTDTAVKSDIPHAQL